ncbi:MAG: hypothetical protein GWN64_07755 [Candidatus Thorarchaeota archaeon]|nr:hypothetical protein [Candidatus Thorarchaeota archaeon]
MRNELEQIKVKVKHLIKPTYLAYGFGFLSFIFAMQVFIVWNDGNKRVDRTIEKFTYIKDRQHIDKVLTENDRYTKVTTFYSEISSTYFQKYHEKYNVKDKWMYQGLSDSQLAQVFNMWFLGSKLIGCSFMLLPAIATRESSGNPISRTYNEDGTILEAGLYNNRYTAVMQSRGYQSLMPESLKKYFEFYFTTMEDLWDPVNATRIEFCLVWGELIYFRRNKAWYITAVHWGNHKISRLYHNGIVPPDDFKFNIGKINEDVRNPFVYYFIINQYIDSFERFSTKVRIDKRYDKIYREKCGKLEREYINSKKYFQEMIELYEEEKQDKKEFEQRRKIRDKKFEKKIREFNVYCIETQAAIKEGRFKKIKDLYNVFRSDLRKFIKEMNEEKNNDIRWKIKLILYSSSVLILAYLVLVTIGAIKFLRLKKKHRA